MKTTGNFKLIGLSKPGSATLTHIHSDKEIFWATLDMTKDRFDALFQYCEGNWGDTKIVKCEFDYQDEDGIPINCKVKEVIESTKNGR